MSPKPEATVLAAPGYRALFTFLLPLGLTVLAQELGGQVLNGGMARVPQATETLAAFGLAWGLVTLLASPLWQTKQLGLVLVDGQPAYRQVRLFVTLAGLLLAALLALLSGGPVGRLVVDELHGVGPELGGVARLAILWLVPFPLLKGLAQFYAGLLIRLRRTDLASYAALGNIVASILAVFALLPAGIVRAAPIRLPLLATYSGLAVEFTILAWGYRRHVRPRLGRGGRPLSQAYVLHFFWPLALIMTIQGLSRPLINLFISHEPGGTEALAVLTVVFTLGRIPYSWLNEIRNVDPAFQASGLPAGRLRRFVAACATASLALMLLLFWTPLRAVILGRLLGLSPRLAQLSVVPLLIFTLFAPTVASRAYLHGLGLVERRTRSMAPSALGRIGAIALALALLPAWGLAGATRGVAALFAGFVAEAVALWWGVRGRPLWRQRALARSEATEGS